jgi:hypothetical protein
MKEHIQIDIQEFELLLLLLLLFLFYYLNGLYFRFFSKHCVIIGINNSFNSKIENHIIRVNNI